MKSLATTVSGNSVPPIRRGQAAASGGDSRAKITIWVVDDDSLVLQALGMLLRSEGHPVRCFGEPAKLLAALEEGDHPQMVMSDLRMPVIDGLELLERVHRIDPDLPVTIVTASRDLDGSVQAINRGAFGYLLKPVVLEEARWLIGRVAGELALRDRIVEEQTRLAHAQRLAQLGILSSGIAHEINNPNCFVRGNIDLLDKLWQRISSIVVNSELSKEMIGRMAMREMPEILDAIRDGSDRISRIVDSLSQYARTEGENSDRCDLRAAIEQSALILRNKLIETSFRVEDEQGGETVFVAVRPLQLEQMLVNLISNAADATAGSVEPRITVRVHRAKAGTVQVDVEDNGTGIAKESMGLLETPFFTTKGAGQGSGLGLFLVRQLAGRAGGSLSYSNNPERGATFSLTLRLPRPNDSAGSAT
jgi:signal transduction histidine kinase